MSKIWDAMKQVERERDTPAAEAAGDGGMALTARQRQAVVAVLNVPSIEEACRVSGVTERTMRRWLKQREFVAACESARRSKYSEATARLKAASTDAVEVLRGALADESAAVRVQAAAAILDLAAKVDDTGGKRVLRHASRPKFR